jgi:hypothetical protein
VGDRLAQQLRDDGRIEVRGAANPDRVAPSAAHDLGQCLTFVIG